MPPKRLTQDEFEVIRLAMDARRASIALRAMRGLAMKPEHLEAERLVAAARTAVERQRELIGQLVNDGYKTGEALGTLAGLTDVLLLRLKDLDRLKHGQC